MVGVGGVAEDPLVLLVKAVHRPPRERDVVVEHGRVRGERDVLPGGAGRLARVSDHLEPGGLAEVAVLAAVLDRLQRAFREVRARK